MSGKLKSPSADQKSWHHTISGWYAINGGIVASVSIDINTRNIELAVHGLFEAGHWTEPGNRMVPLCQEGIDAILTFTALQAPLTFNLFLKHYQGR